jgi:AICAR transformylase/IMP cyclohydrolase PurH
MGIHPVCSQNEQGSIEIPRLNNKLEGGEVEIELKYGCNPHQVPARLTIPERANFRVLSGKPSYINYWMPLVPGNLPVN